MPRALLDVNLLIALMDASHLFHATAHRWWADHHTEGWASCPLTENGMIRTMSQPAYSRGTRFSVSQLVGALRQFRTQTNHQFWPADLSFLDDHCFEPGFVPGHRQLTDGYLLGLAVRNGGRLVTFDQGIVLGAVCGAEARHLTIL